MPTYPYPPFSMWSLLSYSPWAMLAITVLAAWGRWRRWQILGVQRIHVDRRWYIAIAVYGLVFAAVYYLCHDNLDLKWLISWLIVLPILFLFTMAGLGVLLGPLAIFTLPQPERGVAVGYTMYSALVIGWGLSWLIPALPAAREEARFSQCRGHMKQLLLGMYNYEDQFQRLPVSQNAEPGQPPHSWRVAVLPFMDQQKLWEEYHFDQAWDSTSNQLILSQRPSFWTCPSQPREAGPNFPTAYVIPTGPGTWTSLNAAPKLSDITDDQSNTILIMEACGLRIPWTEPRDAELTPATLGFNLPGTAPGYTSGIGSSAHSQGIVIGTADGGSRWLSPKTDPQVLKALLSPKGKEKVGDVWGRH